MTTAEQSPASVRHAARAYLSAGLSVVEIKPDGSKAPRGTWKPLQERSMNPADIGRRFREGDGVGIIAGAVSGNLEILDFDKPGLFTEWLDTLEAAAAELALRVRSGDSNSLNRSGLLLRLLKRLLRPSARRSVTSGSRKDSAYGMALIGA